jgi:hypothetical protein
MCPACVATAALIITGAISTGGLAAVARKVRGSGQFKGRFTDRVNTSETKNLNSRRDQHGEHSEQ